MPLAATGHDRAVHLPRLTEKPCSFFDGALGKKLPDARRAYRSAFEAEKLMRGDIARIARTPRSKRLLGALRTSPEAESATDMNARRRMFPKGPRKELLGGKDANSRVKGKTVTKSTPDAASA